MVMCRDAEKAAKNLKTYLIPMTHTELARAYYSEMRSHVSSEEARIRQEYERSIISAVGRETDTIGEELALLYKQGVTFNNPDIQSSAKAIAETRDVYKADIGRRVDATFVRFRTLNGEQFVEVVTTPNVRVYSTPTAVSGESTKLYTMAELPQDIGEGVAVLTILEDGQYVPKVGMRVNETTFWIERG
jgi:predicted transcriptional regulator